MDVYLDVVNLLENIFPFRQWPDAQPLLERSRSNRQDSWLLPLNACRAVGGELSKAIPAATAIGCMHISIILIDDMLDGDRRGEYRRIGEAATANLASAFQAAGMEAITQSSVTAEVKLEVLRSLSQMILVTAQGQYLDTQNPQDEATYWQIVRTKSSPFFGTSLYVGALLGGAAIETALIIQKFGQIYGEMVQIHDDLNDSMSVPVNPDWIHGRSPLPILFAQTVNHPEKLRFHKLRTTIQIPEMLAEAQRILIRCGAVSYCIHQLNRRYQAALRILSDIELTSPEALLHLLQNAILPVRQLLNDLDLEHFDD